MRKKVLFAVSVALLLVFSVSLPVSAQQITIGECKSHEGYCSEIVKEVPVTLDMLFRAQKMNAIPKDEDLIVPNATCTHTYTEWTTIKSWYESSTEFGQCNVSVKYQMRYCTKCNAAFAREKREQLHHIFEVNNVTGFSTCTICGLTKGDLR